MTLTRKLGLKFSNASGTEPVRIRLTQLESGSAADMFIGTSYVTKGFAEEWLAWHDREKSDRESRFRCRQLALTGWAAAAATVAGLATAIGWAWTILSK